MYTHSTAAEAECQGNKNEGAVCTHRMIPAINRPIINYITMISSHEPMRCRHQSAQVAIRLRYVPDPKCDVDDCRAEAGHVLAVDEHKAKIALLGDAEANKVSARSVRGCRVAHRGLVHGRHLAQHPVRAVHPGEEACTRGGERG
eukprot:95047-Prorocentrum_minimum.AAC.1